MSDVTPPAGVVLDRNNLGALLNIRAKEAIYTPEAIFVSLEEAKKGVNFNFQAQSDVSWDLGDGTKFETAPGKTFTHTYTQPGLYVVLAVGINSFGQKVIQAKAVVIAGDFAEFTVSPLNPSVGTDIIFDGNISAQKAQFTGGKITSFAWTCEGGAGCFETVNKPRFSAHFKVPGQYAITLEIRTSNGQRDFSTQEIFVTSEKPYAHFNPKPAFGAQNAGTYFLDASFSTSSLGQKEGLKYIWKLEGKEIESKNPILTYSFFRTGEHDIELRVQEPDSVNKSEPWKETIQVDSILAVDFTQSEEKIEVGETVDFDAISPNALRYLWTFPGDKVVRTQKASHRFAESGRHEILLKVSAGESENSVRKIISVRNSIKPTALVSILVNGKEEASDEIFLAKGDLLSITSKNLNRFGEEQNDFKETWLVNGSVVSKRNISSLFKDFGQYTVKYIIIDPYDPTQRDEKLFTFNVGNTPPRIGDIRVSTPEELPAGSVRINVQAADKEKEKLTYTYKAFLYTEEVLSIESDKNEEILTLPNGVYDFEVFVQDASGQEVSKFSDLDYVISKVVNEPPTGNLTSDPNRIIFTTTDVVFRAVTNDPDKDALFYDWKVNGKSLQKGEENIFRNTFSSPGKYKVEAFVGDRRGGKVTLKKNIEVRWDPTVRTAESNTAPEIKPCSDQGEHLQINKYNIFQSNAFDKDKESLSYEWSVNGQSKVSTLPNLGYVFERPGKYKIGLKVKDLFVTTEKEIFVIAHPEDVIRPFSNTRCSQPLSPKAFYSSQGGADEIISIFKNTEDFIDQILWVIPSESRAVSAPQNLEDLHLWGRVGIQNIKIPLKNVLAHREQVLLQLKKKTSDPAILNEIKKEIEVLRSTPKESLKNYLELLRPGLDDFEYADHLEINKSLFLQSNAPENLLAPLSFSWDLGDGRTLMGKNIELKYSKKGFYLVTLTISDGLTPVSDSIIIQVDARS